MTIDNNWFTECFFNKSMKTSFKIKNILHQEQSKWQNIKVVETEAVGKLLLLDDKTMISDLDEFVYHEVLAHIPYCVSRNPKNVLIIGGGDGGLIREFARHKSIECITIVEIDEKVIEVSKKFFPEVAQGYSDPRVKVLSVDGIQFLKDKQDLLYDIIIVDSTDPVDFAKGLFTKEFYQNVKNSLSEDGIMMAQTEAPFLDEYGISKIYDNLRESFALVDSCAAPVTIYPGIFWTFCFASKKHGPKDLNPAHKKELEEMNKDLKWYNPEWHKASFTHSNFIKKKMGFE